MINQGQGLVHVYSYQRVIFNLPRTYEALVVNKMKHNIHKKSLIYQTSIENCRSGQKSNKEKKQVEMEGAFN